MQEELLESAVCVLNNLCRVSDSNKEAIIKGESCIQIPNSVFPSIHTLSVTLS